ncbi:MAG: DUF3479 domain-containing protein [Acidobacteria bacterium]|nr:DUF3479 domain-containing protein [Acidobacteriota bacterium]
MKIAVLYVGSSLLAPLKEAEREIERRYALKVRVAPHNLGAPLDAGVWREVERDIAESELVFVIHVTDSENAARLMTLLTRFEGRQRAVIVINCLPELMRQTRMGRLRFGRAVSEGNEAGMEQRQSGIARRLVSRVGTWMGEQAQAHPAVAAAPCAECGAAARCQKLSLSLLLFFAADAEQHSFDVALCAEALRR